MYAFDLATVHVAMYDAVVAIAGRHRPYNVTPSAPAEGASPEAAAVAAAHGVLKALFPSRGAQYTAAYEQSLAAIADVEGKQMGVALGAEVAAAIVALRANDGRTQSLSLFVGGTGPGQYRGPGLVGRTRPYVKPFAMASAASLRPPGPSPLTSATYAQDVAETASLGGTVSSARTPEQAVIARFHTEPPNTFWPRNPAQLPNGGLTQLGGPRAAGGAAVGGAWPVFLPAPPHPEYPAAHGCVSGTVSETLRRFFSTSNVAFDVDSTASGTRRHYVSSDDLLEDIIVARIAGGMHFRHSLRDGQAMGIEIARQVAAQFRPR